MSLLQPHPLVNFLLLTHCVLEILAGERPGQQLSLSERRGQVCGHRHSLCLLEPFDLSPGLDHFSES